MKDKLKFIRKDLQEDIKEIKDPMSELSEHDKLKLILEQSRIDLRNKEYKEAPAYLSIKKDMGGYTPIFTPSNISGITGKAKAKKSFVQSMLIAACVKNGTIDNTIFAKLPKDKENIILLDTEQSEFHVSRVQRRVNMMVKEYPDNLYTYSLRGLDADLIIKLLNHITENIKNIGVIFIDQVADLAKSINSEEEAVRIVKTLERISKEKDLHICCVIHQNKGDNYASGWLGSQIMKKSETVLSVMVDEDKTVSIVSPDLTRNMEFAEFRISINDSGMPFVLDTESENEYYDPNAWTESGEAPF